MSNMATVPVFGTSFTVYVPIVTILVSLMTVMNVNARVLRFVGVESEDLYIQSSGCTVCWRTRTKVALNDEDQEKYELGKKLVASELRAEHSSKTSLNTSSHSSKSRNGSKVSLDGSSVRNGNGLSAGGDCSWLGNNERKRLMMESATQGPLSQGREMRKVSCVSSRMERETVHIRKPVLSTALRIR